MVDVVKVARATKYTVVVLDRRIIEVGTVTDEEVPAAWVAKLYAVICVTSNVKMLGSVALVLLTPACPLLHTVAPAPKKLTAPHTSQSPAVKLMLVTFAAVPVDKLTVV